MTRWFAFALLVLFPLLARSQGADYLPLSEGRTWHYDGEYVTGVGDLGVRHAGTATMRCGSARTVAGQKRYLMTFKDSRGAVSHTELVGYGPGGVVVTESSGRHVLLLPARFDGARMGSKATIRVEDATIALSGHNVGKPVKITVPHGEHLAVPVSARVTVTGGVVIETRVWYAKGVGPIKLVERVTVAGTTTQVTLQLRRVTGGKASPGTTSKPTKTTKKPAGGAKLTDVVAAVVAAGGDTSHASWTRFRALHKALGSRTDALASRMVLGLLGQQKVCRGLEDDLGVKDLVLVSKGDVSVLRLRDCVVFVDGKITVGSYIRNSLVVCTGGVDVSGYVKDSVVVCLDKLAVSGYVKDSVVEAVRFACGGYTKGNVLINTEPADVSRGDKKVSAAKGLVSLVKGK